MLSNIRVFVYEKIEPLSTTILQKYRSGELLARIVGDVESLQNFFLRVFYPPVVMASVTIATILFTTLLIALSGKFRLCCVTLYRYRVNIVISETAPNTKEMVAGTFH